MNHAQQALAILREKSRQDGLRLTAQREIVVEAFFAAGKHITADELHAAIRKTHPEIGFATVHRNLKLLCKYGLAGEMKIGNGKALYEARLGRAHHDHLVCVNCGRIIEVHDEKIERLQEKLAARESFRPQHHRLEIFGRCKDCA